MHGAKSQTARSESFDPSLGYRILSFTVLAVTALQIALLRGMFNSEFPLATLQDLIDGTAYRPFQYRALVPWLVGKLNALSGADIVTLYQVIDTVALIGVVLATRYLLKPYLRGKRLDLVSFGVLLLLPWNYLLPQEIALYIPSDMPALAFFTFLLALGIRKKWSAFYPLFALATLNRETTCFVTVALLFVFWKDTERKEVIGHLLAQFVIWVVVKSILFYIYQDNPGSLFEVYGISQVRRSHFDANLEFLMSPLRVIILLSSFGFLWLSAFVFRKRIDSPPIRRALYSLVVFSGAMLIIGNLNETRIFGEFLPLVYAANVLIIRNSV